MKAELKEIADIARGATEREIETEVVHLFKTLGWPRAQIKQDVPISDKGADKADIVLSLENQPVVLIEVKKYGHARDADSQVNRYCRLLRPSPKLALLTDGVRWVFYYVGHIGAVVVQEAIVPNNIASVVSLLDMLVPDKLASSLQAGTFEFLDLAERSLQDRSEDAQKRLRPFFALTVKALMMHGEAAALSAVPSEVFSSTLSSQHKQTTEQTWSESSPIAKQGRLKEYDSTAPPNLSFTALTHGRFCEEEVVHWNGLLRTAVKTALKKGITQQQISRITSVNLKQGSIIDNGYAPLEGTEFSLQGVSAPNAWQSILKLAKEVQCSVQAEFRWQNNDKASAPGQTGLLKWSP